MPDSNSTPYYLLIALILVLVVGGVAWNQRYAFTAPGCVKVTGINEIVVDMKSENVVLGCRVEALRTYLKKHRFKKVQKLWTTDGPDVKYAR